MLSVGKYVNVLCRVDGGPCVGWTLCGVDLVWGGPCVGWTVCGVDFVWGGPCVNLVRLFLDT